MTKDTTMDYRGLTFQMESLKVGDDVIKQRKTQEINNVAGEIAADADVVVLKKGAGADNLALTIAVPTAAEVGKSKIIYMDGAPAAGTFVLTLTNKVIGGTAGATATFDADREMLSLIGAKDRWLVTGQAGVTLA